MTGGEHAGGVEKSVLIVEDEVLTRLALGEALREARFNVIEASSGDQAKRVMDHTNSIAVVVTDLEMPGMDGLSLARWVRARHPRTKIVIVSGRMPADAYEVADAVFEKPYDMFALVKRVAQLLRNGSAPPSVECA